MGEPRQVLPDVWFPMESEEFWARESDARAGLWCDGHAGELSEGADGLVLLLPLWASMPDRPVGGAEDGFTALVGARYGSIHWDQVIRPTVPEHGYDGRVHHEAGGHPRLQLRPTRARNRDNRAGESCRAGHPGIRYRCETDVGERELIRAARERESSWQQVADALGRRPRQSAEGRALRLKRAAEGQGKARDVAEQRLERAL
ncbi:hypothetical protein [Streptomyces sp. NPDC088739]|uniref:hypothetical protein n=1 Tax=Streptomyces sp. NPDC088739 TaxID=3365882 RepID=UPI00380BA6DB